MTRRSFLSRFAGGILSLPMAAALPRMEPEQEDWQAYQFQHALMPNIQFPENFGYYYGGCSVIERGD